MKAKSIKRLLILAGITILVPLAVLVILPLVTALDVNELLSTKQSFNDLSSTLIWVRLVFYSLMIFIMPKAMNVPNEKRVQARWYSIILVVLIEAVLVQRLWLF